MVRREAEDVVPPLLDGELGRRPLPSSAAAVAGRWSVLVLLAGLLMGIPPGVGKHVHVVGLGVHQVLFFFLVVGRPSPAVAVLGRRRPPSAAGAAAAGAAAGVVAQADLHRGRLELVVVVGISKTGRGGCSTAAANGRRAVETPRQRFEQQIHRHGLDAGR